MKGFFLSVFVWFKYSDVKEPELQFGFASISEIWLSKNALNTRMENFHMQFEGTSKKYCQTIKVKYKLIT